MNTIKLSTYYKGNHEHEFFIAAFTLYENAKISDFLDKYDFLRGAKTERHKKEHDLRLHVSNELDEFNFLFVRLAVAIELSIKGIAIHKGFDIFKVRGKRIYRYGEIDINSAKTYELQYFLENLTYIIGAKRAKKYYKTFTFFQRNRNDFVHFSRAQHQKNNKEIIRNFRLLQNYFEKVVRPLKERASKRKSTN